MAARVFGRSATQAPTEPAKPKLRVLRADGQRIDLTRRDAGQSINATRQKWQDEAWNYRALIGELRFASRLLARSVARCRFYVAEAREWPDDPVPLDGDDHGLDPQLAADALANFNMIPFDSHPDGFTSRLQENLGIAGEAWVHIDERDRFHVRSTSEVSATNDGKVTILTLPTGGTTGQRALNPDTEVLVRCWVPHPQWGQLADSALASLLDVAEDVVLAGREQRAAARSRLAANGILLMPDSLSLVVERDQDEDDPEEDAFFADFTSAVLASVNDDGNAQAVVPIVIRGDAEDLDKVRHVTITRDDPSDVVEKQQSALLRLLKGMDVQPEQVEGIGGANHWTGWIIDSRAIRDQVVPAAETLAACLMQAVLRSALESLPAGYAAADLDRIMIAVDPSPLAENPNRGQDARDAWDRKVISDAKLREDLGYDDDDAPDDTELVRRMALGGNLPPELLTQVLGIKAPVERERVTVQGEIAPAGEGPGERRPVAQPGHVTPENPVPDTLPSPSDNPTSGPIVAAAAPDDDGWNVQVASELAEIDQRLADRLQVACDDAIARVLERAGGKVRSAAQKDAGLRAAVNGMDAHLVPVKLGRAQVESFVSVSDLLADGYRRLRGQFTGWLAEAAAEVADALIRLLGLNPDSARARALRQAAESRLTSRTETAWGMLADTLDEAAARVMFEPDPFNPVYPDEDGQEPVPAGMIVKPREIENVLRAAGGGNHLPADPPRGETAHRSPQRETTPGPGGFGTGPDVSALLAEHGGVLLGWEWQYRPQIGRGRKFQPWHTRLDKVRFSTFTDPALDTEEATKWIGPYYYPGDHLGCFVAGTEVSGPPATGSFVRPYSGEGVEIRTQSGKLLTGTPNHPILTPRGWVPLGELREGDEVVVTRSSEGPLEIDAEDHQVPALIEDVCASLPMTESVVTTPVPTSAEHFHGDGAGSDGQVTVVRTDRRLLINDESAGSENVGDRGLLIGREGQGPFTADRIATTLTPGDRPTSQGLVTGAGEVPPLLRGQGGHAVVGSSATVPSDDAVVGEESPDHGAGAPMFAGQSKFARSIEVRSDDLGGDEVVVGVGVGHVSLTEDAPDGVETDPVPTGEDLERYASGSGLDEIVQISRIQLNATHVYNLSTTTGWYVANGVVVHNCKCRTVPILAIPELDDETGGDIVQQRLREAAESEYGQAMTRVAADDTAAGRVGTSVQMEVEVRDRLREQVERLRAKHIGDHR